MSHTNLLRISISHFTLGFLLCTPALAQQQSNRQLRASEQARNEYGDEQSSGLTQENLGRVAASAGQSGSVLVRDEGLMVELKRWVAKEASDSGQVVEDSNLSDQAIFERLERDVAFRSVATRLLQRYGYLTPKPNPDSDFAKEKELVLKERARRLVQIESQEDSESLRPERNDRDLERTTTCDPHRNEDCRQQVPADRRQRTRAPGGISAPETNPQGAPEQQPSQSPSRILRADGLPQAVGPLDDVTGTDSSLNLELTSSSARRDTNPLAGSRSLDQGALDGLPAGRNLPSMPLERSGPTEVFSGKGGTESPSGARYTRGMARE